MTDITSLSLSEIQSGLAEKKFSSFEATKAYLSRIEKHSGLNSFVSVSDESALESAKEADKKIASNEKLALLGVPIAIKDVICVENLKNSCGSKILSNFISPYDASVVSSLKKAGAVILGKTNMDEFAMGSSNENSFYGPCKNPWNPEYVPGGSSGGSAVAVSASLAPVALGTDTGGSIRQPASFCSVVGLKPTYGRVSRYGVVAYASSLDQVGPFTRNVKDCAIISQIIFGHDKRDSTSVEKEVPDLKAQLGQSIKGLKIGIPKEYFIDGVNAEVMASLKDAMTTFKNLGAEIIEVSLPHTEYAVPCYYILAPAEASSNLARYDGIRYGHRAQGTKDLMELYCLSRSQGFGKEVKRRIMIGTYVLSSGYYDAFYLRAQKIRNLIAQDFKNVFADKCDVILSPTAPTTAFRLNEKVSDPVAMYLNDIFTIPVNLAGLPGISLPCGFDSKNMPIGMQLIGNPWDEATLLKTAFAFESATEWHKKSPQLEG